MLAEILSEWGIIVVVVAIVFLFGANKLPKFAKSIGSAQKEYKKGLAEGRAETPDEEVPTPKSDS